MNRAAARRRHREPDPERGFTRKKTEAERAAFVAANGESRGREDFRESSTGRHCKACGRVLDREQHEFLGYRPLADFKGRLRQVRNWRCRVRLVARHTAPVLGEKGRKVTSTYVPDSAQRTKQNQTAFVPLAILAAHQEL